MLLYLSELLNKSTHNMLCIEHNIESFLKNFKKKVYVEGGVVAVGISKFTENKKEKKNNK